MNQRNIVSMQYETRPLYSGIGYIEACEQIATKMDISQIRRWQRIRTCGTRPNTWLIWGVRTYKRLKNLQRECQNRPLKGSSALCSTLGYIELFRQGKNLEALEETQLCLLCMELTRFYSIMDWETGFWTVIVQIWRSLDQAHCWSTSDRIRLARIQDYNWDCCIYSKTGASKANHGRRR